MCVSCIIFVKLWRLYGDGNYDMDFVFSPTPLLEFMDQHITKQNEIIYMYFILKKQLPYYMLEVVHAEGGASIHCVIKKSNCLTLILYAFPIHTVSQPDRTWLPKREKAWPLKSQPPYK